MYEIDIFERTYTRCTVYWRWHKYIIESLIPVFYQIFHRK